MTRHRYNKRQSDFSALKEYNDYLEETEAIIFNLCEGVETRATETKVEAYRRENAADIARRGAEPVSTRKAALRRSLVRRRSRVLGMSRGALRPSAA